MYDFIPLLYLCTFMEHTGTILSSFYFTLLDFTIIRKELEISGIQDVRAKHKQNWINHLERMDNTGLPQHALSYKSRRRRDRGRPRKRWQRVDAGTGQ